MLNEYGTEGIEFLLGLGAKYCVQCTQLNPRQLDKTSEQLWNNVRWEYIFNTHLNGEKYLPGLYIDSKRIPSKARPEIEACINNF
jgi:hypothetical protein